VKDGHPDSESIHGRPAIGAVATAHLPDGRRMIGLVDGGNGHAGRRAPELHFGLGKVAATDKVKLDLRWRDGAGRRRTESFELTPGYHTILLGHPQTLKQER
jgi:hypothetical protein